MQISEKIINLCNDNLIEYRLSEPMKNHTTFKTGGNADIMVFPHNYSEILKLINQLNSEKINYYVIGNGSNLLVADNGIRGCVIQIGKNMSEIKLINDNIIYAQAGASLSALCNFALQNSLTGLEFAYGIPGTVGGAIRMNAGAYGGEIKDTLINSTYLSNDKIAKSNINDLAMSYRYSRFCENKDVILSGEFSLEKGDKEIIRQKMNELLNKRKNSQPLEYPNGGSTFKRPDGAFAAKLIDDCGLKGYCIGDAQVSEKHSGFVINKNNAKTDDILKLITEIQNIVKDKTGFTLETEIEIL